jgi:hypothetical protein
MNIVVVADPWCIYYFTLGGALALRAPGAAPAGGGLGSPRGGLYFTASNG